MSSTVSKSQIIADRIKDEKPSVWVEFIQLAIDYKPLNLGQGFPDFAAPEHITKALSDTALSENPLLNQYTRGFGHPRLVNAISKLYSKLTNREINPQKEILVTVGAYEALYCIFMGLVNPGDEVIIIEPFFDCYAPMTKMAGGVPVFVPLRPNKTGVTLHSRDWVLDPEELESKFSTKTKLIVVNTPHNPLGKIFSYEELNMIANLCKKYDCIALMDEVYEWIVFEDNKHIRMNTLPGMWERTITVGSAGKTFSVTGWKLGWAYGPEHLIRALQLMHQNCVYTCATPIQESVAIGFETEMARMNDPTSYWAELSNMLEKKRNLMASFLEKAQMNPTIPEGGYFMLADFSKLAQRLDFSSEEGDTKDYRFVKWLSKNKKLQGIPPSAFYSDSDKHIAEDYIRFCFFKKEETLLEAERILNELKQ
ncbi:Kynurenine--oxoglutarate transaminase 3-like protein [Dinothrombium tinctorium]|uniref:Kynurenine--oxoglutarate transaminase 3-like protein n=1 Tax=Dinothrombium tinctorium TaxID=1965070 RepID=A0A3S3P3S3_9ACAR|nr:Kynurenine--oxoglutarate transaminase 3-like protein [Dinothrombium tinctorium]RWS07461.1 Kynurenine--oxoglutarate transaminase 3-like protein [Dinothrombium tinctorium]RWS09601.1 Kynurenine--oxoglutarate transaminase 3-like protein [Dinothrombium tinctorium]